MTLALTEVHSGQRGGPREINIVSESGLYALVMRCRDAMRRICENLGMDWASQSVKLSRQSEKFARCDIATHDTSGRLQEMVAIPVRKLALWLACIISATRRPRARSQH
jgi:hypothetical protein